MAAMAVSSEISPVKNWTFNSQQEAFDSLRQSMQESPLYRNRRNIFDEDQSRHETFSSETAASESLEREINPF